MTALNIRYSPYLVYYRAGVSGFGDRNYSLVYPDKFTHNYWNGIKPTTVITWWEWEYHGT